MRGRGEEEEVSSMFNVQTQHTHRVEQDNNSLITLLTLVNLLTLTNIKNIKKY